MFNGLRSEGNASDRDSSDTRKHKASSPLDADKTLKKYREHQNSDPSDSDQSYIEIDKSPQCDPPTSISRTLPQSPVSTIEVPQSKETPDSTILNRDRLLTNTANTNSDVTENQPSNNA